MVWLWHFLVNLDIYSSLFHLATAQSHCLMLIGGMMVWAVCVMVACSLVCVGLTMTFLGKFEYVYIYIYIYLLSTWYIWYIDVYKYMIVWEFGMIMEVWYDCVKCSRVYLPLYLSVYLTVCLSICLSNFILTVSFVSLPLSFFFLSCLTWDELV